MAPQATSFKHHHVQTKVIYFYHLIFLLDHVKYDGLKSSKFYNVMHKDIQCTYMQTRRQADMLHLFLFTKNIK